MLSYYKYDYIYQKLEQRRVNRCARIKLFRDIGQHNKPHVHVYYGEYEATIAIDGELLAGSLPHKQLKIVTGWLAFHEEEAYKAWNLAVKGEHFDKYESVAL